MRDSAYGPGPRPGPGETYHQGYCAASNYGAAPGQGPGAPVSSKSQIVAALLAYFLGALGVHNFYLGQNKLGMTKLVMLLGGGVLAGTGLFLIALFVATDEVAGVIVAVLACALGGILTAVVGVWGFVEFILILMRKGRFGVDEHGLRLS